MRVGVPKEIKVHEYRVGLTPAAVREYVARGHEVLVETGAGQGIGEPDDAYARAGAKLVSEASAVLARSDMIVKVKEPQKAEWERLREGQIHFTYLHLAVDPEQARGLMRSGCSAIAYETVTDSQGGLPLLAPMSEVAGRLVETEAANAAVITGSALIPGSTAPKLLLKKDLGGFKKGSVLVDVSIDQGGCFETSHATTHADPTFTVDRIIHYCVANMPGSVPLTSAKPLTTLLCLRLAGEGLGALRDSPHFLAGLNILGGRVTHPAVATSLNMEFCEPSPLLQLH
jgi:alanine dehydrogenase